MATSGKMTLTFPFFQKNLFYFISIFLRLAATFQNQTEGGKKKLHGNFYELLVPKHQRHLLY